MTLLKLNSLIFFYCLAPSLFSQKTFFIYGKVTEELTNKTIENVSIKIINSNYGTSTLFNGIFHFYIPSKKHVSIVFSHIGYEKKIKEIDLPENKDSVFISVSLLPSNRMIDTVSICGTLKPDTLVHSPSFSICDFDFYENNYILLTQQSRLKKLS